MKNSKKILIVAMSILMIIATIIPGYAISYDYTTIPDDIGNNINGININSTIVYMEIQVKEIPSVDTQYGMVYVNGIGTYTLTLTSEGKISFQTLNYTNNTVKINLSVLNSNNEYETSQYYEFTPELNTNYYITLSVNTSRYLRFNQHNDANITLNYYVPLTYNEQIEQSYNTGYNAGYNAGVIDTAGYQQDLNLVEHCEQLLGTFVGDEYAHYITPLCLVLVVILIYFLFIRWLLALVKSKNVTRVADIIVCTACILMLVIMYAPMLDLTTNVNQYNHQVYEIATDTTAEVVRSSNITVIPTETGTILDGPVGRVVIPVETVYKTAVDTVYKIVDDVVVGG